MKWYTPNLLWKISMLVSKNAFSNPDFQRKLDVLIVTRSGRAKSPIWACLSSHIAQLRNPPKPGQRHELCTHIQGPSRLKEVVTKICTIRSLETCVTSFKQIYPIDYPLIYQYIITFVYKAQETKFWALQWRFVCIWFSCIVWRAR